LNRSRIYTVDCSANFPELSGRTPSYTFESRLTGAIKGEAREAISGSHRANINDSPATVWREVRGDYLDQEKGSSDVKIVDIVEIRGGDVGEGSVEFAAGIID